MSVLSGGVGKRERQFGRSGPGPLRSNPPVQPADDPTATQSIHQVHPSINPTSKHSLNQSIKSIHSCSARESVSDARLESKGRGGEGGGRAMAVRASFVLCCAVLCWPRCSVRMKLQLVWSGSARENGPFVFSHSLHGTHLSVQERAWMRGIGRTH